MGLGAPAVVAAHAHLLLGHAHHRVVDRRQFVGMTGVFQLVGGIGQHGGLHAVFCRAQEPQAPAAIVRHFRPAHAGAVAAFLRQHIAGDVLLRRGLPQAQLRAMAAIHVVFARPHAVIAHLIVLRVQHEQHPELRHVAQFLHRVVAQLRVHPAAGVHGVAHRALGRRGGGQRVEIGDAHAAVHLVLHLRLVHGQTVQGR